MPYFVPFPPSNLSTNVQKPEKVVNERTGIRRDTRVTGGISMSPTNLIQDKNVVKNDNVKTIPFCDAVILVRAPSLPMCVLNLRIIHSAVFELSH